MKVKTWVEFEQEVDVEVSIAEVMSSIGALADSDRLQMTFDCINCVHRVLSNIPAERIQQMNDAQRHRIGQALHEQSQRFWKLDASNSASPDTHGQPATTPPSH